MNIKYFLLFLLLNITFSDNLSKKTDIFNFSNEKSDHVIKRDIDLYTYNILFGSCIPIGANVSNNYNAGSSLSLIIHTPYQTPNIINRFKFNVSAELSIKNMPSSSTSAYNIMSFHMLLDNPKEKRFFNIAYGLGFAEIFQSDNRLMAPSIKGKVELNLDFYKIYTFLIKQRFLNKNLKTSDFLKRLDIAIGGSPEIIFGYAHPQSNRQGEFSTILDIYFKINLLNL